MSTLVVNASYSGVLYCDLVDTYLNVHNAANATLASSGQCSIGQAYYSSGGFRYQISRTGLLFDTSALGVGAGISAVILDLYGSVKLDTDATFDLTLVDGVDFQNPVVVADYGEMLDDTTSLGTFASSSWVTTGYNTVTLNAAGIAKINKTGTTKLSVRSSRDISSTAPTATNPWYEYIEWENHTESGKEPRLTITYTSTPPTVTTQTCMNVIGTTATGKGNVTALGDASVTAHGHCWNTSTNPTTANDKVDNGAKTVTGAYLSLITGLTAGTGYYTRAYATNANGTSYGANVYFIAGQTASGQTRRHYWSESSNLHGFDQNQIERIYVHRDDVDDTPVDAATTDPVSSNWAYDHQIVGEHSEIHLTPKASSTGAEGTIFYDSDDDHVWVATE